MQISAVIPVHSEKETITEVVEGLVGILGNELFEIILVVAPNSPQETFDICFASNKKHSFVQVYTQKENPGVGRAFREGFALAKGSHVLMIDSDGEMPVSTVKLMVDKMKATNCDMVIGSRWLKGGGAIGYEPLKYFLNRCFQTIFRIIFWTKIHDLSLSFKLMKAEIAHGLIWTAIHTYIGAETSMTPIKLKYHVEEVPTVWQKRKSGVSRNTFGRNFLYVKAAFRILTSNPNKLRVQGKRDSR